MNQAEIRDYRRRKGISQGKLAELAGCSQPTISLIERQQIPVAPLLMRNITEILDPLANGTTYQHRNNTPMGHFGGLDSIHRLQFPAPKLPKYLTMDQWKRPELGGDLAVCHVYQKGPGWTVTLVAVDLAGSGNRVMQASAHLSGWLRGVLASRQQPIAAVLESLSNECRQMGLEASAVGLDISGFDQRKGIDIEVVSAAFPPVLAISDPPFHTDSAGQIGPALPLRESEYLTATRLHLDSGVLFVSTDGLLERLGSGEQSNGRREIVKHLTSARRHLDIDDWLRTPLSPRDDELGMVIIYRPWDIEELIAIDDDRERLRVERAVVQLLDRAELGESAARKTSRSQLAAMAIAEVIDNVREHALGSHKAIVRAMLTNDSVRVEIIDDGIVGPPPLKVTRDRNDGVFGMIRKVADHMYVEQASPRGCLVGMVFKSQQSRPERQADTE